MPLSPRNANTMWMLHFLYHLKDGGTAGFVMATGELSNGETARLEVRKALVEARLRRLHRAAHRAALRQHADSVLAVVPVEEPRRAATASASATGEVLFIDGRKLGTLIPGSRKQKQLSDEEIEKVAAVHRRFNARAHRTQSVASAASPRLRRLEPTGTRCRPRALCWQC